MFKDPLNTEDEFAVVKMDPAEVVVLDSSGTMFVADSKNNRVQVTVFNRTVFVQRGACTVVPYY